MPTSTADAIRQAAAKRNADQRRRDAETGFGQLNLGRVAIKYHDAIKQFADDLIKTAK